VVIWQFVARRIISVALLTGLLLIIPALSAWAQPGTQARVTGTGGDGLILRAEASPNASRLAVEPEGAIVTIIGPEQRIGGRVWLPARDDSGLVGWLAGEYLTPVQSTVILPTPTAVTAVVLPASGNSEPEPSTSMQPPITSRSTEEQATEAQSGEGLPLTLDVRFKSPEIDRRDRQTIYVVVTRGTEPVSGVVVRFTVDEEEPEVEREAEATNFQGRSTHEWSMRKYRGTTVVRVEAFAPDGGTGKASRSFFVK
jgi:hypothetical protein